MQSRLLLLKKEQEAAERKELAGDVKASWGDQMRSYVLNPYQMVKDLRTDYQEGNPSAVFNGEIDGFIEADIRWRAEEIGRASCRERVWRRVGAGVWAGQGKCVVAIGL